MSGPVSGSSRGSNSTEVARTYIDFVSKGFKRAFGINLTPKTSSPAQPASTAATPDQTAASSPAAASVPATPSSPEGLGLTGASMLNRSRRSGRSGNQLAQNGIQPNVGTKRLLGQ